MDVKLNTLYITTEGAYLHRDGLALKVEVEKQEKLRVPVHHLESVVVFEHVMVSPSAMGLLAEHGVSLTFLSYSGRLLARVDAPVSGNVLLRRKQFRAADVPEKCLALAKSFVAGKIQNARNTLMRSARESENAEETESLKNTGESLATYIRNAEKAADMEELRGHEGMAAREYFGCFNLCFRQQRADFVLDGRNRRPPKDPVNALLSFAYALLLHDCVAALSAAGLDPNVGFLHGDRPGKPSLALDLMEEFRTLRADRLVLSLVNRKQVSAQGFEKREGGGVEMDDATRKAVVVAWQERKKETLTHPLLEQECSIGQLPFIQARLLARVIRGDDPAYVPCVLK
jgi:CRISPR-associated protein Cas1